MKIETTVRRQFNYILKWLIIAPLIGMIAAAMVAAFSWMRTGSVQWLINHVGLWWVCLGPIVAGMLMSVLFLRLDTKLAGEGMDRYIITVNRRGGYLPLRLGLLKFVATLCVLICCPVGGTVGPMVMVMSGISGRVQQFFRKYVRIFTYRKDDLATAVVCGCAGVVSASLGAPVGGGIFAAEVLAPDRISYRKLFPAMLGGLGAWLMFSRFLKIDRDWGLPEWSGSLDLRTILICVVLAVLSGLLSLGFVRGYVSSFRAFKSVGSMRRWWPVLAACVIAVILIVTFAADEALLRDLFRSGNPELKTDASDLSNGSGHFAALLVLEMVILMMLVASGNSGGLTGPTVAMGALAGLLVFTMIGGSVPANPLIACAVAAMMAGILNVPLAGIVIVIEVMGRSCAVPAIIGSLIAFQIARSNVVFRYMDIDRRGGG